MRKKKRRKGKKPMSTPQQQPQQPQKQRGYIITQQGMVALQDFISNVNARVRQAGGALDWKDINPYMQILTSAPEVEVTVQPPTIPQQPASTSGDGSSAEEG